MEKMMLDLTRGQLKTGIYKHFKGNEYHVFGVAEHTETHELMVVYSPVYGPHAGKLATRPLEMFLQEVRDNKDAPGYKGPRFTLVEEKPAAVHLKTL